MNEGENVAGFIKCDVERVEIQALNTKVNKEVFDRFKEICKRNGLPLNIVIEIFMRQYADNMFPLTNDQVMKYKYEDYETATLNTTFSKDVYYRFKKTCKDNGFFVKHVLDAFMEEYVKGEYLFRLSHK